MIKLMQGDCLERMKEIPDGSVDACVTDAPYGIDYSKWDVLHSNSNSALLGSSPANTKSTVFKTRGKPLNGWSVEDRSRAKEIQQWCNNWLSELYRILKPCSPVLIMTGRQYQHRFTIAAEDAGFILKDVITWDKGGGTFRAQRINCVLKQRGIEEVSEDWRLGNLAPQAEPIVYLFKPYPVGTTVTDQFISTKLGCINTESVKSNLIRIDSKVKGKLHETQKPEELMETLVSLVTDNGHFVIDPFMGSGTTGVACRNLNRKFIGIELDENYFNIAKNRIEQTGVQL